ncbi:hypothetical protein DIPPA_20387 [Diplonema papillatum]|nr:hypothetical protein DIPPA_20387 [Diplonema papillatum]
MYTTPFEALSRVGLAAIAFLLALFALIEEKGMSYFNGYIPEESYSFGIFNAQIGANFSGGTVDAFVHLGLDSGLASGIQAKTVICVIGKLASGLAAVYDCVQHRATEEESFLRWVSSIVLLLLTMVLAVDVVVDLITAHNLLKNADFSVDIPLNIGNAHALMIGKVAVCIVALGARPLYSYLKNREGRGRESTSHVQFL